jgi:hypothetical protein
MHDSKSLWETVLASWARVTFFGARTAVAGFVSLQGANGSITTRCFRPPTTTMFVNVDARQYFYQSGSIDGLGVELLACAAGVPASAGTVVASANRTALRGDLLRQQVT